MEILGKIDKRINKLIKRKEIIPVIHQEEDIRLSKIIKMGFFHKEAKAMEE